MSHPRGELSARTPRFVRNALVAAIGHAFSAGLVVTAALPQATLAADVAPAAAPARKTYDIPAGPLEVALNRFGRETGLLLSFSAEITAGLQSRGLRGNYSVQEALPLLLQGTGLAAVAQANGGYALTRKPERPEPAALPPVVFDSQSNLPEVKVKASMEQETATSPVIGFIAKRSATGTKTDTPIIETPQSISVVTADRMAAIGATTLRDALAYTPGVNIAPYGPDSRFESTWFYLRGFDTYNPGPTLDGLSLRNNYTWAVWQTDNYASERVDVLRGPSSVLYGQASPGGTVNIVSKRPSSEPIRELQVQLGNYGGKQVAGDFAGPVNDDGTLLYRVTSVLRKSEYPVDGIANDRVYVAPALTWKPNADTSLTLLSHYLRGRAGVYSRVTREQGSLVPNPDGSYTPASTFVGDPKFDHMDQDQWAVGYNLEHRLNDTWQFRQNLRYGRIKAGLDEVFSGTSYVTVNPANLNDPANFRIINRSSFGSHETARTLSIDNHLQGNWTQGIFAHTVLIGLDYQNARFDQATYYGDANAPLNLYAPVYGQKISISDPYFDGTTRLKQTGLYGQWQSKIDNQVVVTVGGRYDRASIDTDDRASAVITSQTDGKFTGRAGLVYLAPTGLAPYVSYSQSFVPTTTINPVTRKAFDPETAAQLELGLRYQPPGTRDSYSMAVFDLRRQNYITNDGNFQPRQTGEITVKGIEMEAVVEPLRHFNLTMSYAWTPTAKITASSTPAEIGVNANGVSEHAGSLWADYRFNSGVKLGLGARYNGTNHGISDAASTKLPAYTVFDVLLGYDFGAWDLKLNIRNAANKTYLTSCGYGSCYYGDVRKVTATATYRW
ncbi:TonB-dependent siderophore receptor [Undibacterium sp. CY18W]|uniref:TonB-dependent siderophore receptor n=2 Tax=Undibacterium hunanense TaxID=2762292 RepID=A0ABR6ZK12_9BURK|nr:TonB-dependent siderophore receptor [Undibacterium hunanense]